MGKTMRWLLILVCCYPLGCVGFWATCEGVDRVTAMESNGLLAQLRSDMTPEEVEAIVGRPFEYDATYGTVEGDERFSHNWTVGGHRLEVIFKNGCAETWHTFGPDVGPVKRFFGWVFFWWLFPFISDD